MNKLQNCNLNYLNLYFMQYLISLFESLINCAVYACIRHRRIIIVRVGGGGANK